MYRHVLSFVVALPLLGGVSAADGLNQFAVDSYVRIAPAAGSFVFSPLSISTALAMALSGARGKTAEEIAKILHHPPDAQFLDMLAREGSASGDELRLASGLWVERNFPLLPEFTHQFDLQFHAKPAALDFSKDPESARAAINRWTSDHTKGRIPELFAPGVLERSTRLVLTSAVYFNGKWQSKFDAAKTQPAPFHTESGSSSNVPFMNQEARFSYGETDTAQVLEMPYSGGQLAFDVILPKSGTSIATAEQALASGGISAILGNMPRRKVQVALPKFRAESSFSLREALSAMGMGDAFTGAADFSGINGRRDLALSQVVHKAFIDVSEEGTEAAAATGAAISLTAMAQPLVFRADHPFIFVIRHIGSGAVLFAGRYDGGKS